MKTLLRIPRLKFILSLFVFWRVSIELFAWTGQFILEKKETFAGPSIWANFDGVHYLAIALFGYAQFQQAFFPLYPILIRELSIIFDTPLRYVIAGLLISNISFLAVLFLFAKLLSQTKINNKKISGEQIRFSLVFLTFSPASFYFGSIYTESLFLFLVILSFMLFRSHKFLYGVVAAFASATRLVGAFLLVPIGLVIYMVYLGINYHDPLMFMHVQPLFGAGRSGGEVILLPQVYWRYLQIFLTVPITQYHFFIAVVEFVVFNIVAYLLWRAWKMKMPMQWILFSLATLIVPTLSGTFSSMLRYSMVIFPLYLVLASFSSKIRIITFFLFYMLLALFTVLFTRGYWVA